MTNKQLKKEASAELNRFWDVDFLPSTKEAIRKILLDYIDKASKNIVDKQK